MEDSLDLEFSKTLCLQFNIRRKFNKDYSIGDPREVSEQWLCINYIIYCNYSHYYFKLNFKQSAL